MRPSLGSKAVVYSSGRPSSGDGLQIASGYYGNPIIGRQPEGSGEQAALNPVILDNSAGNPPRYRFKKSRVKVLAVF